MTLSNPTTNGQKSKKTNCTKVYSTEEVISTVKQRYAEKNSLRRVAQEDYQGQVTFGDIQRIMQGIEPVQAKARIAFGLQPMGRAPVCLKCGEVHVTKRCTSPHRKEPGADPSNQGSRSKPIPHEHYDQVAIIAGLQFYISQYPVLEKVTAIPNGGLRKMVTAKKIKAEGGKAGVPDLVLMAGRRGYIGIAIEVKHGDNTASEDQKEYIAFLEEEGWYARVMNDVQAIIDTFVWYASGKKTIVVREITNE